LTPSRCTAVRGSVVDVPLFRCPVSRAASRPWGY